MSPDDALKTLAAELREEGAVVAPHVVEAGTAPVLGQLAAAGPRSARAPGAYAIVVEAVREGYLLHYGEPRLLPGLDPDLRLLLGDHLYARGIEGLAALGDQLAVDELADLISLTAQLNASTTAAPAAAEVAWVAAAVAIAAGPSEAHAEAKAELRGSGDPAALWRSASQCAAAAGISAHLTEAAEAVGFSPSHLG